jgi:hypothetical protein
MPQRPTPPNKPTATKLRNWRVAIMRSRARAIGTVQATDRAAAEAEAIRLYGLDDDQRWTSDGSSIIEHVAGVEDFQVAQATYRAAVERWPGGAITLRQGARVIEDSRRTRFASWADKGRQGGR